ncbi:MAG: MBL fold metallo-hydrolase RNA specificity domain-containing protein [Chloroflexota bacterium]|nr:MBL fold metallo-hydrolase RNA specificity domain-containing protein [Chloroflexota bacterium]
MVSITVYGGARTIGGNKILLEDGDTRLFFDFGTDYHTRGRYFAEFLNPRSSQGLLDPLVTGLIPALEGLYRDDLVPQAGLWAEMADSPHYRRLESVEGVLISHAHMDHLGHVSFLRTDIPIYASAMTAVIAKAIQDSSGSGLESEYVYATERVAAGGIIKASSSKESPYISRPYVFADLPSVPEDVADFWTQKPLKERELSALARADLAASAGRCGLRAFPVDHSIYGATAWAVETGAGWVVYTGDVRTHGRRSGTTEAFVRAAAELEPRVVLCEGTRLPELLEAPRSPIGEAAVLERALAEVKEARGIVVADFAPRNIERLETFLTVAKECGRKLVVLSKDAYLLAAMRTLDRAIPTVATTSELLLWEDSKASLPAWQERLCDSLTAQMVGPSAIRGHEGEYIMCWSLWDLPHLVDLRPAGGKFIYSSSEVYDEEGAADIGRVQNWASLFGMDTVGLPREVAPGRWEIAPEERGLHASGHADARDIIDMIKAIRPKMLIPVHTEHPEIFKRELADTDIEVRIPSLGEQITIG